MRQARAALLVAAAGLAAPSCSGPANAVPHGTWGGRNAELIVTPVGALARFRCGATGSIDDTLLLDASSSFDVPGVFVTPLVAVGVQPARYVGSVSGSNMTLVLSVSGQPGGTFQLRLDDPAVFDVCNL